MVFPAESYAEKEGTVTHPDGRVQRLRPAIGHPARCAPGVAGARRARPARSGHDLGVLDRDRWPPSGSSRRSRSTPALTLEEIGGRGVRWQERERRSGCPPAPSRALRPRSRRPPPPPPERRACCSGTFRSIWAAPEVEASPALHFLHPEQQRVELSPADARRLGIEPGDRVEVARQRQPRARAPPSLRAAVAARGLGVPGGDRDRGLRPRARPSPLVEVRKREPRVLADRRLLRALVDADPQGDRDLRRRPSARAGHADASSASCSGRFQARYGPNRVGPYGVLQPLADILKLLAKEQFRPAHRRSACCSRSRPLISIVTAVAAARDHPVRRHASTSSARRIGLYGIDVSIGPLYLFAFGAHRLLRADARRLGLGLEVLVPRRDARRRPADLLRGRAGALAPRRGHHRGDALAHRASSTPSRACGTSSRSSSAS